MLLQILPSFGDRSIDWLQSVSLNQTIEAKADRHNINSTLKKVRRDCLECQQEFAGTPRITCLKSYLQLEKDYP